MSDGRSLAHFSPLSTTYFKVANGGEVVKARYLAHSFKK